LSGPISTPTISAVVIGPLTIHFYAFCFVVGVSIALWLGNKRFTSAYPTAHGVVGDVAIFAIPAGVIGGRIYHVITSPQAYFGSGGHPADAFKIWNGGLGIWGAIALGTLVAWFIYAKVSQERELPPFLAFADALAPGILIAQAVGRWGNWFNGELFGRPLQAPWSLQIPRNLRPIGFENYSTFHPTFLYESLWCFTIAVLLLWVRRRLPIGSIFLLYICLYSVGRFFIEGLRIDSAQSFGGLRLNQYVALFVTLTASTLFTRIMRQRR